MTEMLALHQEAGVLTLTFNRPEVLNALNNDIIKAMQAALKQAERDQAIRCLVLTGMGRAFSSGQDLRSSGTRQEPRPILATHIGLQQGYNQIITSMHRLEKPIIAKINGVAAGIGFSIALAADIRIASDAAWFTAGFSKIGLVPDGGMSFMLPLLVGLGRASELIFTSDRIDAAEAYRIGLVNHVVPAAELDETTQTLAQRLATMPTRAIGLAKRSLNRTILADMDDWLDYESYLQDIAGRTADHQEGVRAFLENRQAVFKGE